jgi:hypothetical protein
MRPAIILSGGAGLVLGLALAVTLSLVRGKAAAAPVGSVSTVEALAADERRDDDRRVAPPRRKTRSRAGARSEGGPEQERDIAEVHAEELGQHRNTPRFEPWSGETARRLDERLAELGDRISADIGEADCRKSTCTFVVSWASRDHAVQEHSKVLHFDYQLPCSIRVIVPPGEPSAESKTTAFMRCYDERSAEVRR